MIRCFITQKAGACRDQAMAHIKPVYEVVITNCSGLKDRVSDRLNEPVSDTCILHALLITLGIIIGMIFSDFFKKHRKLLIVTFIASAALFVYKAYRLMQEWEEDTEPF